MRHRGEHEARKGRTQHIVDADPTVASPGPFREPPGRPRSRSAWMLPILNKEWRDTGTAGRPRAITTVP